MHAMIYMLPHTDYKIQVYSHTLLIAVITDIDDVVIVTVTDVHDVVIVVAIIGRHCLIILHDDHHHIVLVMIFVWRGAIIQ